MHLFAIIAIFSEFRHILAINSVAPCRYVSEELSRAPSVHAMDLTQQDQTLSISPYHIRYKNNETDGVGGCEYCTSSRLLFIC